MRVIRIASFLLISFMLAAAAVGQDQPLPESAEQALREAEATMQEALATYESQYPDRELWQQTFALIRRAQSLAPGHSAPQRMLAEAYSRSNWYGPAWEAWLAYLNAGNLLDAEATRLFTEVGGRQGYNYYSQGRLEAAAEVYSRVIEEVPFDLEAHTWMGRILLELGRPEAAISYWQTVVDRNPTDGRAEYFLQLARDQARWGREAVLAFREGVAFYEQGDFERARERFARASSLNESYAEAWAWLGRVAFEAENYSDARTYYERAAELAPGNETYRYFREESRRRLGSAATSQGAAGA